MRNPASKGPGSLIIAPSDELAKQVSSVVQSLSLNSGVSCRLLSMNSDSSSLYLPNHTNIAISDIQTLHHIRHLIPKIFEPTKSIVIDEADMVLGEGYRNMKFQPLETFELLSKLKPKKQFIFACATLPKSNFSARDVLKKNVPEAKFLISSNSHQPVSTLTHKWIDVSTTTTTTSRSPNDFPELDTVHRKYEKILEIVQEDRPGSKVLIFANHIKSIDNLYEFITDKLKQFPNLASRVMVQKFHREISHLDRKSSLEKFMSSVTDDMQVLICTDALSRGFDFSNVDKVVQFEIASNAVTYLHRIGRTARAGRTGQVINLYDERETEYVNLIKKALKEGEYDDDIHDIDMIDSKKFSKLFSRKRSLRDKIRRRKAYSTSVYTIL